jgi:hypothetical protein
MEPYRILHMADLQVQVREIDLGPQYVSVLEEIEAYLTDMNIEVYLIPGDLAEYAASNDAEKKIIYSHISRALAIPTVLEVVVMNGNHDLHDTRRMLESIRSNNAMDTFRQFVQDLDPKLSKKLIYLKDQKVYRSAMPGLSWVSYSLEGGRSNGSNLDKSLIPTDGLAISVYHDILKEYVDETKLPVKKEKYDHLASVEDFATPLVLAGDIHENWSCWSLDGSREFIYPGSPIQRNFGEGAYFRIRKSFKEQLAAEKVVKLITVTGSKYATEDLPLGNYTSYVTIDMTTSVAVDNFMFQLESILGVDGIWGLQRTFIKFKMSTSYTMHEMSIVRAANEAAAKRVGETKVDVSYDKFVLADSNEVKLAESEEELEEGDAMSMDRLILDNNQLATLFAQVLENQREAIAKEFADEAEIKSIMESVAALFAEQLSFSMNSTPNYAVELDSMECNCFMALGKNKIDLNIPGLTRITGTNGIGKTTLYNMMRWVLKNEIMENMPKNTKVKNALHIFNDNLPEIDTALTRLTFRANGTKVQASRWATRTWKSNTTPGDKAGRKWKNFVTGVNQGLKLQVFKEGVVSTEKIGDEAQLLLDRWFGKVPSTIMILNQQKILSMLNMPANELTQLVLDYIGVDYLNALESNLSSVKDQYDIAKPKSTKEQLRRAILTCDDERAALNDRLKAVSERLAKEREMLKTKQLHISYDRKYQLEMGNIPKLIEEQKAVVGETEEGITSFEEQEKAVEPTLSAVEPVHEDTKDADKIEIERLGDEMHKINEEKAAKQLENEQVWIDLENSINEKINEKHSLIDGEFAAISREYGEKQIALQDRCIEMALDISAAINKKFGELTAKEIEAGHELDSAREALRAIKERDAAARSQLENGVCSECKRPMVEDPEHWKIRSEELVAEIAENKPKIEKAAQDIVPLYEKHEAIRKFVSDYSTMSEMIAELDYNKVAASHRSYSTEITGIAGNLRIVRDELGECLDIIAKAEKKELSEHVKNAAIPKLREEASALSPVLAASLRKSPIALGAADKAKDYAEQLKKIDDNDLSVTALEEVNQTHYKAIQEVLRVATEKQNLYVKELKEYQEAVKAHNTELERIRQYNVKVEEHNRSLEAMRISLEVDRVRLEALEAKLPKWDEVAKSLAEQLEEEAVMLESISECALSEQKLTDEAVALDLKEAENLKLMDEYLAWQRKTLIFNIYQKLIKKDFRDIIFNYYRTFLNGTLNILLEGLNFKLYWDESGDLYMVELKGGHAIYRPVQLVSGMETAFQGLALIYAIHLLNVKNSISTIFIDEISGQLNTGKELAKKENTKNYQEMLLVLLAKFDKKNVFIIDHNIEQMFETQTYQVVPGEKGSEYIVV